MVYDPELHHRRSIRLRGYDYAAAGAYFVTICTQGRECFFGEIDEGIMQTNAAAAMVEGWWHELIRKFPTIALDSSIVMPDHFHGILFNASGIADQPTLSEVVEWFKTMTTNAYIRGVKEHSWPPFPGRLWQRNYFERIVRNEAELNALREYIKNNPAGATPLPHPDPFP